MWFSEVTKSFYKGSFKGAYNICRTTHSERPATLVRVLTPSVSPNQKSFKVVLVCCSRDPSPHPLSIFDGFSGSFAFVCSRPSGVPVTSLLFLAAFEHVLHLFVFVTNVALPVTHSPTVYFWQLFRMFHIEQCSVGWGQWAWRRQGQNRSVSFGFSIFRVQLNP